ncbi:MAG TPA: outer membrane protein transport protein [Polyangiaceae bacterium]
MRASKAAAVAAAVAVIAGAPIARAAGYDTPILYSARHQGMGGTAIAYVDDPSATFHNPAGLAGIHGLALLGDLSLILGKVQSSPQPNVTSLESEPVLAPFFMLAAGYRIHEWVSVGLGFFPVASGGAEYKYEPAPNNPWVDRTRILFLELTPAVSLNVPKDAWIPGELSVGAGYRVDRLSFEREQGLEDDPRVLNLHMNGTSFTGFRVGAQYHPIPQLGFGAVFRNRIEVDSKADKISVYTQTATDASLRFILPAKLGGGVEFELTRIRLAADVEYAFQSQNDRVALEGTLDGEKASVPNIFAWHDGVTLRTGAEYRILYGSLRFPVRIGYVFDSAVSDAAYPSAFGTPPAPTHSVSAGGGADFGGVWQLNAAITHRFGKTTIDENELGDGCRFCSYAGDYELTMTGFYLDASVNIDL